MGRNIYDVIIPRYPFHYSLGDNKVSCVATTTRKRAWFRPDAGHLATRISVTGRAAAAFEWSMEGVERSRAVGRGRQRRHRAGVWPHDAARLVSGYGIAQVLGVLPEPPSKILVLTGGLGTLPVLLTSLVLGILGPCDSSVSSVPPGVDCQYRENSSRRCRTTPAGDRRKRCLSIARRLRPAGMLRRELGVCPFMVSPPRSHSTRHLDGETCEDCSRLCPPRCPT